MEEQKPFYITTTLPYVNAKPHFGHALEIIQADVIARAKRLTNHEVVFNMGTDEHGVKIYRAAEKEGKEIQAYTDEYAAKFEDLKEALSASWTHFVRTTDKDHQAAAQAFWERCDAKGDIYKKQYSVKYCVGCELEKTDSELEQGKCPIHPTTELEHIDEENYFFKFSKYQDALLKLYKNQENFVVPAHRLKEIRTFVEGGLQDFSISRKKEKMPWGVPVPGDDTQVMYVWFDALVNYISTLGWPEQEGDFLRFWPGIQVAGKDNLRQQAAIWQAMLISADLPSSKQVFIHGFINSGGIKMSKSIGNVIDPYEVVNKYGTDATRYFLLTAIHPWEDSDFTFERFEEVYNSELAGGIGNFVSRVLAMAAKAGVVLKELPQPEALWSTDKEAKEIEKLLDQFSFQEAAGVVREIARRGDKYIQDNEPFRKIKDDPEGAKKDLEYLLSEVLRVGALIEPFLPETSSKIYQGIQAGEKLGEPLFARIDA